MEYSSPSAYGKRPLWQWILIYLLLGGIIYAGIYYFYFAKKGGYSYSPTPTTTQAAPASSTNPDAPLLVTKTDPQKGTFLAAANEMTLYIFDEDAINVSNCSESCAQIWPPYVVTETTVTPPVNLTTFKRADGSLQYAYKGKPVYYYSPDNQPGDILGDGVEGTWHLVKP